MRSKLTKFKELLQFSDPENQVFKIGCEIDNLVKDNRPHCLIKSKYNRIKQFKKLNYDILLNL